MDLTDSLDVLLAVSDGGSEQAVLERLVSAARSLTGAVYGAAVLLGPDGRPCALAHQGMTTGEVAVLPRLPGPVGLIGTVLRGETLRLTDMAAHPDSVGFPPAHVPMAALLGVPITLAGRVLGGLYLTQPPGAGCFTAADERVAHAVCRLAGTTVIGVRRDAAHEDLLEQLDVTGSRRTDADYGQPMSPAIRRLLAAARDVLGMELTFLSRLHDGVQTFTHVDADSPVAGGPAPIALAEGSVIATADGYCTLMLDGRVPPSSPDLAAEPLLRDLAVTSALGVGAYCGVPVRLPDGSLYGSLCGLHPQAAAAVTPSQLETLTILARLIGQRLAREAEQTAARQVARRAFLPLLAGVGRGTVLQPIVDLTTGAILGFEALSRFSEVTGAPRRPDATFAQAHAVGLGVRLEHAAARDALALLPGLPAPTYLSINLSPQAVLDPAVQDSLSTALADGAGGRLVLELTEHEQVVDYPALLQVLSGLRHRGLRLAVDDTGAGFASLQHVTMLQPDIVKLDIAFVRDVDRDPSRRAVARCMAAFADELDATLIAEGIESAAEVSALLDLGAPVGQGYHLGRPQDPATFTKQRPMLLPLSG